MDWRKSNIRLGKISQYIFPGFGFCSKCNSTWNLVQSKSFGYSECSGHFALCEKCYDDCTIDERIYYYTSIDYIKDDEKAKECIINNILKESGIDHRQYRREKSLEKILDI